MSVVNGKAYRLLQTVNVRWSGKKFENIPLDLKETGLTFKMQLYSLTEVLPERQKIMVKGGILKDETDLSKLGISEGHTFMMMGTAEELPKEPVQKPVFLEDMTDEQLAEATNIPGGLVNLGNTCYMNASLQCLKAIPELSNALINFNFNSQIDADVRKTLTVSLRDLFNNLSKTVESSNPLIFLNVLRLVNPQFSQQSRGQFMQQDAEECWSCIVNVLKEYLKSGETNFVNRHMSLELVSTYFFTSFFTSLTNQENADEAPTTTNEVVDKLNCHISGNVNYINDGLNESMIEVIEKTSPSLGRQCSYSKKTLINRLPKYLTLNMLRFYWKPAERVKAKILRKVKFPLVLDMYEYCTDALKMKMEPNREAIRKYENEVKLRGKNADVSDLKLELSEFDDVGSNTTGFYELTAVLTHIGRSADSGHYIGWTKDQSSDKWWKFDDDKVSPATSDDILKLDGGGDWHTAYLLIYKAKSFS
ncbi:cysteine proteinase [Rozella allomycis CSF55]|uniref:Ubiquitin carboxyl-terminal hydrolase n=1 Tax=Rozella allomycis (strain CSF55) TaxID=988480 RepID=A0A075B105_ROZAC|nr:Peptidase C19, ubiquitin carboxyl-terminal hydrolase 2 domain-containing protein [Rozella allomycis CSF55]RKP21326.1 cysteine proteinase [Rozella allomycis CSF55]|eukprot:EPZ34611.1 Peptidase C19, ubiquitin carboxyl-terminal hydrolase 2 domain-containing protein [Rozella allomycis CSF55]